MSLFLYFTKTPFTIRYTHKLNGEKEQSWSYSYGSWIFNYLCRQCLSPLKFVRDLRQLGGFLRVLPASSTNTTDRNDITEILLKVTLNTINNKPSSDIMIGQV